MYTMLSTMQNMPYLAASIDYLCRVSYSLHQRHGNIAQENTTNQTANILVEDQLQPPLDLAIVAQEQNSTNPTAELSSGHFFGL